MSKSQRSDRVRQDGAMRPSPRWWSLLLLAAVGCGGPDIRESRSTTARALPDERPVMVNREPPFHYPGALYARKLQGNVTLRLFVDSHGVVVADSTEVEESSGLAEFDSAAVIGSRGL